MVPRVILNMVINGPEKGYVIGTIVSDDDSTMKAHSYHQKDVQNQMDKGKVSLWISERTFLADPSHRIKVLEHTMNVAYESGVGLDIGYTAQVVETVPKPLVCKWSGLTGHKTKRSSKCLFNHSNVAKQMK